MKNQFGSFMFGLAILLLIPAVSLAQTSKTFVVSATVPSATSVSIIANSVNSSTGAFTLAPGTALSFNPLTFNSTAGAYFPDHFFAVDVVASGGAGSPSATVTYTEGTNPNSPAHGLGWKSTATFVKTTGSGTSTTDTPMAAHGPKKLLKDVGGESITSAETTGGWLRVI